MTKEQKRYEHFQRAVKLVTYFQLALEAMDEFKGTRLYRQNVKNKLNQLESEITAMIKGAVAQLDKEDIGSELFNGIQERIELILSMSLEELAQLKLEVEETRGNEEAM